MRCPYCKGPMIEVTETFELERDGQMLRLEDVPAWLCESCDHVEVDPEVIETVEDMLDHLDDMVVGATEEE